MLMKRVATITLVATLLAGQVQANTYSNVSTVKGLTLEPGTSIARVVLTDMTALRETCASDTWYAFNIGDSGGKEMYATLLAAKLSGNAVYLQANGCVGTYSKITLVYVCDTMWCQ